MWCQVYFHMYICHFYDEMTDQFFLYQILFSLLNFKRFFAYFGKSLVNFGENFFHLVMWLFMFCRALLFIFNKSLVYLFFLSWKRPLKLYLQHHQLEVVINKLHYLQFFLLLLDLCLVLNSIFPWSKIHFT